MDDLDEGYRNEGFLSREEGAIWVTGATRRYGWERKPERLPSKLKDERPDLRWESTTVARRRSDMEHRRASGQ